MSTGAGVTRLPILSGLAGRLSLTIVIALLSFVSLGLPDAMLGVAWPTMGNRSAAPARSWA